MELHIGESNLSSLPLYAVKNNFLKLSIRSPADLKLQLRDLLSNSELPYHELPNVHIVKEFDINAIANQIIHIIRMSDTEYRLENDNQLVNSFLQPRSNWENVSRAESKLLINILGENSDLSE